MLIERNERGWEMFSLELSKAKGFQGMRSTMVEKLITRSGSSSTS